MTLTEISSLRDGYCPWHVSIPLRWCWCAPPPLHLFAASHRFSWRRSYVRRTSVCIPCCQFLCTLPNHQSRSYSQQWHFQNTTAGISIPVYNREQLNSVGASPHNALYPHLGAPWISSVVLDVIEMKIIRNYREIIVKLDKSKFTWIFVQSHTHRNIVYCYDITD